MLASCWPMFPFMLVPSLRLISMIAHAVGTHIRASSVGIIRVITVKHAYYIYSHNFPCTTETKRRKQMTSIRYTYLSTLI
jgi:hypothetical protein